jgi:hypothetical protein
VILTDVLLNRCDHCGDPRKVVRLEIADRNGERVPFCTVWLCAGCLRRLADFVDRSIPRHY